MSGELANKVNLLCQKIKKLSRANALESAYINVYLSMNSNANTYNLNAGESILAGNNQVIPVVNIQNNCTFNNGQITVALTGTYKITYEVTSIITASTGSGSDQLILNVNGISLPESTYKSFLFNSAATSVQLIIPIVGSFIIDLRAGDVLNLVAIDQIVFSTPSINDYIIASINVHKI